MTPKKLGYLERIASAYIDWNGADMVDGEPPRGILTCRDLRNVVHTSLDLYQAAEAAIYAIDNVLSSHEGQAEYESLKNAFSALELALSNAEKLPK